MTAPASLAAPRSLQSVTTRFGSIAYEDLGSGPAAIFVHGVFLNGYLWRHVSASLQNERRCLALDLLGHGGTQAVAGQPLTFQQQADMLLDFCDALGLDQIDLVGNDSGGGIAQLFAVHHHNRLRTLTLTNCDTHTNCPPEAAQPLVALAAQGGLGQLGRSMLADLDVARATLGVGYEHPDHVSDVVLRAYLEPLFSTPERTSEFERLIAECFLTDTCHETFVLPALRDVPTPTLIVWGDDDVFFHVDWAHWLHRTLPSSQPPVIVPRGRLFFPEERPDALATPLRAFWRTHAFRA